MKPILMIFCLCVFTVHNKLADTVSILLPTAYDLNRGYAQQLVSTDVGCYQWASTSSDIAVVEGYPLLQNKCFRKGLVRLVKQGQYSSSVYISAKDINSQQVVTISLRLRNLDRISIFTKYRVMNIRQVQQLQVYGFDNHNNTFTSLDGLRFEWKLEELDNSIKKIPLKDSSLLLHTENRKLLEAQGFDTDIIVVKALKVGMIKITVRCLQQKYQSISQSITLYVQERFQLVPSDSVNLLSNSKFSFKLFSPTHDEIALPKSYYRITSKPDFKISNQLLMQTPNGEHTTYLKIQDTRTQPPFTYQATVNVYEPDEIRMIVKDYLIVGRDNKFRVQYYHQGRYLRGTSSDLKISSDFPIQEDRIRPTTKRSGKITVDYHGLTSSKTVIALLPLAIVLPTPSLHLPIGQSYKLLVLGGSGQYSYKIEEKNNIGMVTYNGQIKAKGEGETIVVVTDKSDEDNQIRIKLVVSEVAFIKTLEAQKESNINEKTEVYIIGQSSNLNYFSSCNDIDSAVQSEGLEIDWSYQPKFKESIDYLKKEIKNNTNLFQILRKSRLFSGKESDSIQYFDKYVEAGHITQEALENYVWSLQNYGICNILGYQGVEKFSDTATIVTRTTNKKLYATFQLRVYNKLQSIRGQTIYMTPFSRMIWTTKGGTEKWDAETQVYLNGVQIIQKYPIITCPPKEMSLMFDLQLKNPRSNSLLFPISHKTKISIQCKYPEQLHIRLNNSTEKAPEIVSASPNSLIYGSIYATDHQQNQFYNYSNLIYNFKQEGSEFLFNENIFSSKISQKSKIKIQSSSLMSSNDKPLNFNKISASLEINVEQQFLVDSKFLSKYQLLLDQNKQIQIPIQKATKHLEVKCKGKSIDCNYNPQTKTLKIRSIAYGESEIRIWDNHIIGSEESKVVIDVVEPDRLEISSSKESIQEGEQIQVELNMYKGKNLIDISQYNEDQLNIIFQDKNVKIISKSVNKFIMKAYKQGRIKLYGQLIRFSKVSHSINSIDLYIYPPLGLNLKDVKITQKEYYHYQCLTRVSVGCNTSLSIFGGPENNLRVKYNIQDIKLFEVVQQDNRNYQFLGRKEGFSFITFDIFSGAIQIAHFKIGVIVKEIDGFTIHSSDQLVSGAQFRLIPDIIIDGERVDDSICHFSYHWKSTHPSVIYISESVHQDDLIQTSGAVNATASQKGSTEIQLTIKKRRSEQVLFTVVKVIKVVDIIQLRMPTLIGYGEQLARTFLIPPNSGYTFDGEVYVHNYNGQSNDVIKIDELHSNQVKSGNLVGVSGLKLVDHSSLGNRITSFISVAVTPIRSVFIQNQGGIINLQVQNIQKIRFYIQDSYGRLFNNNLHNVNYVITLSNPQVVSASISQDKNWLNLKGRSEGDTLIYLTVEGTDAYDVIPLRVGVMIHPVSPVYVHIGGNVKFTIDNQRNLKWTSHNPVVISIDPNSGISTANAEGQTSVEINGMKGRVIVYKAIDIRKINQKNNIQNGVQVFKFQYRVLSSIQGIEQPLTNIRDPDAVIDNNLNFDCQSTHPSWFETKALLGNDPEDNSKQIIQCFVNSLNTYPEDQQIPEELNIMVAIWSEQTGFRVSRSFSYPFNMMFRIAKRDKSIYLTKQKSYTKIFIKTNSPLEVSVIGGDQNWVESDYLGGRKLQKLQINMDTSSLPISNWRIKISNPNSNQIDYIEVTVEDQKSTPQSWFALGLTDWIILFLAITLVIIYLSQKNVDEVKKYN